MNLAPPGLRFNILSWEWINAVRYGRHQGALDAGCFKKRLDDGCLHLVVQILDGDQLFFVVMLLFGFRRNRSR